jgi:hypothetical protein
MTMTKGHRLQIVQSDTLVAEVIVESFREAERVRECYVAARYKLNLPMGCSVIGSTNSSRLWNVPVGSVITKIESKS